MQIFVNNKVSSLALYMKDDYLISTTNAFLLQYYYFFFYFKVLSLAYLEYPVLLD